MIVTEENKSRTKYIDLKYICVRQRNNSETIEEHEELMCQAFLYISFDTLQRLTENFIFRLHPLCDTKVVHLELSVI